MTSIPRLKGEEILCYFTSHKFIIACKSHLLFFFAPILILDVLKWFCASDHREEFNIPEAKWTNHFGVKWKNKRKFMVNLPMLFSVSNGRINKKKIGAVPMK